MKFLQVKSVAPIHIFFYSCAISHSGVDFQIEIQVLVPHFLQMEPMMFYEIDCEDFERQNFIFPDLIQELSTSQPEV